jgi:CheY-like chemotaxis protein
VVEDNIIVGMETEGQLLDLGAAAVDLANSVPRAMDLIASHAYEFVLLDANLGNETSRQVAEALTEASIPYAFLTGYGEVSWARADAGQIPVLTKPLDTGALGQAVVQAQRIVAARTGN